MGSTAKIYFGCFITVSIIVMFLLFSMQNSAQLKLDIQHTQQFIGEKDQQISAISNELESTKAAVQNTNKQNDLISELKGQIQAKEQERLIFNQQLEELETRLQNQTEIAEKRLAKNSILQKQQQKDQQLLIKDDESKAAADKEKAEFTAALRLTQEKVAKSEQSLRKVVETLEAKNRVIQMCETNLTKIKSDMIHIQNDDLYEDLNINLILDELASKADIVEQLTYRLEQAEKAIAQGK